MIKVEKQETFWLNDKGYFIRRTELVNKQIIWERPSQYGTFTNINNVVWCTELEKEYQMHYNIK